MSRARFDLEAPARQVADLVAGVRDDQLAGPTPSPAMSVGDLVDHLRSLSGAFAAAARKQTGVMTGAPPPPSADALEPDWRRTVPERVLALAAAWRDPRAWEGMTQAGGIDMPGEAAATVALDELVLHGWDLAVATGQPYDPSADAVSVCLGFAEHMAEPQMAPAREGLFGPVLPVPDGAQPFERLLRLAGRDPQWHPQWRPTRFGHGREATSRDPSASRSRCARLGVEGCRAAEPGRGRGVAAMTAVAQPGYGPPGTGDTSALEQHRTELRGYCYRMLGSVFDADDAVQETLVKAWQGLDAFEGRSSLRSWLYRIATNVCLDSLRSRQRRALPMDLSSPVPATTPPTDVRAGETWVEPAPSSDVLPSEADPAHQAVLRDSVRLAFVAALQTLPPRQRAVLILREVLGWPAADVATLLDTTVASVNSALQRARATLGATDLEGRRPLPLERADAELLERYVRAFEAYDMTALVALLREDATMSMPPFALWLSGRDELIGWFTGFGAGCADSRMVPVTANGLPAFGQYKPDPERGVRVPWALQVLELDEDGRVRHLHAFVEPSLFTRFGLPDSLPL